MLRFSFILFTLLLLSCSSQSNLNSPQPSETGPASFLVRFYRGPLNHLSAVRHGHCPMHPSCSEYAAEAIEKHGEIMGWIMACDRLMRCGRDETRLAQRVRINGQWRYEDPVPDTKPEHQAISKEN